MFPVRKLEDIRFSFFVKFLIKIIQQDISKQSNVNPIIPSWNMLMSLFFRSSKILLFLWKKNLLISLIGPPTT